MVLDHAFPPDLRVENEARTLVAAGFEVAILAIGEDSRPEFEDMDGVRIRRYRLSNNVRNKLRGLAGSVPLIEWVYGRAVDRIFREWPFDALHAHDLYLFGACLRAGRRLGVKVVGDMHENWVHALSQYRWSTRYPGKAVINLDRWDTLETRWSTEVDRLIVVIDEMKERMIRKSIREDHIVVVPNTISRAFFDDLLGEGVLPEEQSASADGIANEPGSALNLIYTGGMDLHRGLASLVSAMPAIRDAVPDVRLTMVGDGATRPDLEKLSQKLGVDDIVSFKGWQPQETIPAYIQKADIGLIPHLKSVHTDNTIPHKLFHYMYLGLPVVASNCDPLQRIIDAEQAGSVYSSGDSGALATEVIKLARDTDLRIEMGRRGKAAVVERYNWEHTAEGLIEIYDSLLD
jgi:glycosyltransferase involved in cell wall biosynthesis